MSELPELIANLQLPGAYSHQVDEIELRETHISWVLLTGEFAYKVKKPVQFPFLDYSTLEKREAFCHQELRLNRQFAPDIYLDVVPITGSPSQPNMDGDGPAIEYAVKMRQFDERGLLSELVARDELQAEHIDRLAERLAEIHQQAKPAELSSSFASPQEAYSEAIENLDVLEQCGISDERIVVLRTWTDDAFQRLNSEFHQRKQNGFVRECHGDLHLRNVVLLGDKIELFDGIEFNDAFRWIDVMSDAAFLEMDLTDQGCETWAHRFRNRYFARTGDYAGLAVLRWYLVYRALVRAKVAALRIQQEQNTGENIETERSELSQYLDLATTYSKTTHPTLMITHGVSGSGKTTGTQQIVEQCGAVRVRSDVERKRILGVEEQAATDSKLNQGAYSEDTSAQVYQRLLDVCRIGLKSGFSVIADATFLHAADRMRFQKLAKQLDVDFCILPFEAPLEELRQRIQQRARSGNDASEATIAVLEAQLEHQDELTCAEREQCSTTEEVCHRLIARSRMSL